MIKSCGLILILFCMLPQFIGAQDAKTDSLLKELVKAKEDSSKTFLLRNIGATYYNQDPRKAIAYWRQAVDLSYKLNFTKGLAINYINIGLGYSFLSKMDSSIIYTDSAIKYSKIIGEPDRLALAYLNKADAYRNLGNFGAALLHCDTASEYAAVKGNTDRLARIYDIISGVYLEQKKYHAALGIQAKALAMYKKDGNGIMEGQVYDDFGLTYQRMDKLDSALHFYKMAIGIGENLKDYKNLCTYYLNMASVYVQQAKFKEAELYLTKALRYGTEQENNSQLAAVYNLLSEIYFKQERYAEAIKAGETAYKYSLNEVIAQQQAIAELLAKSYQRDGDDKNAFKYLSISSSLKDSMIKDQYNSQVASLQSSFEVKEKDKEILLLGKDKELQQQKLSRQRLLFAGAAVLLLLALSGIALLLNRNKLKQRMKELELRNQIAADLHDEVGSSLSSIHMLSQMANTSMEENLQKNILDKVSINAKETMERMSDIVWMIKPGESEAGSLKQRMERFAYEICGSKNIIATLQIDELEKLRLTMEQRKNLYLIFKEAINNAVKYSGTEKIEVKAMMQQKQLELLIQDFGNGFDVSKSTRGNGLGNMLQRAKDMQAQLHIESTDGNGTSVKLQWPV
jgi:two-component system, NarL family, sensor histidine kinase UhpB